MRCRIHRILVVGQTVKNYPELCKLLNEPVYTGIQKQNQLKEFKRYFDYEKSGHKFLITDVYSKPKPKEYKVAANSKYVRFIESLLLSYLSEKDEEIVYVTQNELCGLLGIVNSKYFPMKNKKEDLLQLDPQMDLFEINNFYSRSHRKFKDIIDRSFISLKRRLLIDYDKVYRIGVFEPEYGNSDIGTLKYHDASEAERKYILKTKRQVLKEFGYEFETQIYLGKNESREYYARISQIFREDMGWEFVNQCYRIIYDRRNVIEVISKEKEIIELNALILGAIDKQAEDIANKEVAFLPAAIGHKTMEFTYPDCYVDMQRILSKELIDIKEELEVVK